jgi:hypothetical protein
MRYALLIALAAALLPLQRADTSEGACSTDTECEQLYGEE